MNRTTKAPTARRLLALVGVLVLGLTMLGKLDQAMGDMHEPSGVVGTMSTLTAPLATSSRVHEVRDSWQDWAANQEIRNADVGAYIDDASVALDAPYSVGTWWLVIDTLAVVPAGVLLMSGLLRRRQAILATGQYGHRGEILGWLAGRCLHWLVPAFVGASLVQDGVAALVLHGRGPSVLGSLLGLVSLARMLVLVALVLPIAMFTLLGGGRHAIRTTVRSAVLLRIPLLGAVYVTYVLAHLPAIVRDQLDDIMRDWAPTDVLMNTVGIVALGALLAWVCNRVVWTPTKSLDDGRIALPVRVVTAVGLAGMALTVVGLTVTPLRSALVPTGLLLFLWAALSWPPMIRALSIEPKPAVDPPHPLAVRFVATLPVLGFAMASADARIGVGAWDANRIVGLGLPLLALVGWWFVMPQPGQRPVGRAVRAGVAATLCWFAVVWIGGHGFDPLFRGTGSIGMLMIFTGLATAGFAAVDSLLPEAAGALKMAHIHRIPLVTCLAVCMVAAASLDVEGRFHRVHTLPGRATETVATVSLDDHLQAWADAQPPGDAQTVQPLFLLATSGGGVRAAYWQVLVDNCLFRGSPPPSYPTKPTANPCRSTAAMSPNPVAIASGVSGGSVGLVLSLVNGTKPVDAIGMFRDGWIDAVFGNLFFVDIPNALLHLPFGRDRARALEQEWIRRDPRMQAGLFATQRDPSSRFPLLLLNSTTAGEGCRMSVSVLAASATRPADNCREVPQYLATTSRASRGPLMGATRDVADYLQPRCGSVDLSLATAASLSARFPIISPPGVLVPEEVHPDGSCTRDQVSAAHLIDGAFVDASGARPIIDLIPDVVRFARDHNASRGSSACIQPVVIQVDNAYAEITGRTGTGKPGFIASLGGFASSASNQADAARQELARLAQTGFDVGCPATPASHYVHIHPVAHPGIEAPLGWTLSKASRLDLESQMYSKGNVAAISCVKAWLTGREVTVRCASAAA